MNKFKLTCAAVLLTVAGTQAHAANIVVNGGFETGDFTGWTVDTTSSDPWQLDVAGGHGNDPFDGTYFASTGCVGEPCITGTSSQQASLSQDLTTTVGDTYTLTFEFGTGGNGSPNELAVLFGGNTVEDLLNIAPSGYTLYTVSGLLATAPSTQLEFLGRQDPGWDELDDVSVVDNGAAGAAPEPASLALGLSGLAALLIAHKRRKV